MLKPLNKLGISKSISKSSTEGDLIKDGNDKILRMNEISTLEQDANVKFGMQACLG